MDCSTRRPRALLLLTLAAGVALAGGCSRRAELAVPPSASLPPASPATSATAAPTPIQADRWGSAFVAAIVTDDVVAANAMIDWDAIFDTATSGLPVPEVIRGEFVARGRHSATRSGLVSQLTNAVAAGGDVAFVRSHAEKGECHALVRVIQAAGLNYYDARLVLRDGQVRAADIDVYLAGEPITATLRRYFVMYAAAQADRASSGGTEIDPDLVRQADLLQSFFAAAEAGDHARVLEVFEGLPASLQRERAIGLARVAAAAQVDAGQHSRAMAELRTAFPDAACVDLVGIDHHSQRGEHEACLASIDRLDHAIGGDPYLDVLRATACLGARDHRRASTFIEKAIDATPGLLQLYWIRVAVALEERNHRDTAAWLDTIAARFDVPFADLEGVPEYAEFVKSPEYRQWTARRRR